MGASRTIGPWRRRVRNLVLAAVLLPLVAWADDTGIGALSLNVWTGDATAGGRQSIADLIQASGAGIVGLQEVDLPAYGEAIGTALGEGWHHRQVGTRAWYSRYEILELSPGRHGVRLALAPDRDIWVFNVHLRHYPYGPYQLVGIPYQGHTLFDPTRPGALEAVVLDQAVRVGQAEEVLADIRAVGALSPGQTLLLLGDFNEPSSLDWTDAAHAAGLHIASVAWPTSQVFLDAGLRDSWRSVYPDEVAHPGVTWSTRYGPTYRESDYPAGVYEPQDRIDWILHAGALQPIAADLIGPHGDDGATRFHGDGIGGARSQFPSDHRGVLVRFRIADTAGCPAGGARAD